MVMRAPIMCIALAVVACQAAGPAPPPAPATPTLATQGQTRAEALCGGCHAIGRDGVSPNRNAPPFHAIINQVDLRSATVASWLRDAHNYPSEMRFSLTEEQVNELVAHMMVLRDPNYRRSPD